MPDIKNLIKSMTPGGMRPLARRLYRRLPGNSPGPDFSRQDYEDLAALKCIVSYNKYGGYCVPESSRHRTAAQKILSNDVYEPETIEFIISNCGDGDVVHAGAYFGDFLPALSKALTPGSRVWAFEPNPENYRCARITLEINGIDNVALQHAGLGARREMLPIRTVDKFGRSLGGASRVVAETSDEAEEVETVQILTIDETVGRDRNVSIIHLDIEGHEEEALRGALKTIQRCLPIVILEVWPNSKLSGGSWFSENILSLGYRETDELHANSVFTYGLDN